LTPSSDDPSSAAADETIARHLRTAFLSRIAHDIRSPTGVASGALHELETALGPAADEQRVWLTMIRRGMKRLLRLADRLSMAAELEAHPIELAASRADLGVLVTQAIEAAKFVQSRSAVTIDAELAPGEHPAVYDARWLEPAIVDVLCNAIRFAYRRVRVTLSPAGTRLVLSIEDDGAGISPEAMASLFVRFAPAPGGGGGLSLPIAQAVVGGHGGRLSIEPSTLPPGRGDARGARVVIELDAAP